MGFGIINFAFAFVAIPLLDTFGRRFLLLATFPFLAVFQFVLAFVSKQHVASTVIPMYLFCAFYSIGEGPIPFVSSIPFHPEE